MHGLLTEGAKSFWSSRKSIKIRLHKFQNNNISKSNPSNQHIDDFNFGRVIQSQFEPTYFVMRHKPMNYLASCPMWSNWRKKESDWTWLFAHFWVSSSAVYWCLLLVNVINWEFFFAIFKKFFFEILCTQIKTFWVIFRKETYNYNTAEFSNLASTFDHSNW